MSPLEAKFQLLFCDVFAIHKSKQEIDKIKNLHSFKKEIQHFELANFCLKSCQNFRQTKVQIDELKQILTDLFLHIDWNAFKEYIETTLEQVKKSDVSSQNDVYSKNRSNALSCVLTPQKHTKFALTVNKFSDMHQRRKRQLNFMFRLNHLAIALFGKIIFNKLFMRLL